jgi:predicted Zn-dependent protease with MMP-like domain
MSRDERLAALWTAYARDEGDEAVRLGARLAQDHPGWGPGWNAFACALERQGRLRDADRCFTRANRCTDDPQGLPYRVGWGRLERLVAEAGEALPGDLRGALSEVPVLLADYAAPDLLDGFEEPELLGLFTGRPRAERQLASGDPDPAIHLWRRAHEHACTSMAELRTEIRQTLWHELGHYLGYDEDELDALGRG